MMIAIFFRCLEWLMADVGPLESAQMDGTAHAPRQGDIFLKPLGTSSPD